MALVVVSQWRKLSEQLVVKYNDGCITDDKGIMRQVGYSRRWLSYVGYFNGPISYQKLK